MTQQPAATDRRKVLKRDILFACSMLFACSIFVTALIATPFWEFEERQQIISANATATAVAHATELAQYEIIDTFDTNRNRWRARNESSEYWDGSRSIRDGVYSWEVTEVKDTFISWANYSGKDHIKNFDVYVDTKVAGGKPGDVCSGFLFRISLVSWSEQYYYFSLCNNSIAIISYHSEADGWQRIATLTAFGHVNDWNRLEISARGSHFEFFVNGERIYEMDDGRLDAGSLALVMELNEKSPAKVLFDNFGFQPR